MNTNRPRSDDEDENLFGEDSKKAKKGKNPKSKANQNNSMDIETGQPVKRKRGRPKSNVNSKGPRGKGGRGKKKDEKVEDENEMSDDSIFNEVTENIPQELILGKMYETFIRDFLKGVNGISTIKVRFLEIL